MPLPPLDQAMRHTTAAHQRLMETLTGLTDARARAPSALPGWSRGHLLTHIARNADSHVRLLRGALRGESVEQYPGGPPARAAEIEAGSTRPAAALVTDVDSSARRLYEVWDEVDAPTWEREVVAIHAGQPAWACVYSRWRETEIHHVDLDLGYEMSDWPDPFVEAALESVVGSVAGRLPPGAALELRATDVQFAATVSGQGGSPLSSATRPGRDLLAWMTGRAPPGGDTTTLPPLGPWM